MFRFAMENITNKNFDELIQSTLFDPLAMKRTSTHPPKNTTSNLAVPEGSELEYAYDFGDSTA
jgi:CubicO group peptidase (beta-lactamase class C family)